MTVSNELYFLRVSKVWSLLIHGSVGRVRIKNLTYILTFIYLFAFFFHHKICVFIIFIFFLFDEIICVFIIFIFFLFLTKYKIPATEYWPIRNTKWWQEMVSGTVCTSLTALLWQHVLLWLTSLWHNELNHSVEYVSVYLTAKR